MPGDADAATLTPVALGVAAFVAATGSLSGGAPTMRGDAAAPAFGAVVVEAASPTEADSAGSSLGCHAENEVPAEFGSQASIARIATMSMTAATATCTMRLH